MKAYRLVGLLVLVTLMVGSIAGCGPAATQAPAAPAAPAATEAPAAAAPAATEAPAAEAPAATEAPAAAAPAEDATLVMAMNTNDLVTLDPGYAGETTNLMIHINTYDTLVDIRPEDLNTVVPRLAESWTVSEDWKEYTFKLRSDVKFASGNPLTADDVVFTYMRLINIKGAPSFNLDGVIKVEAIDPLTVKVTFKETNTYFLASAANASLGIQDSKLVKEHGGTDAADADKTDKAKEWLDQNSAGSGPYVLTKWAPKAEVVLEANKNYFKGAPYFSKVVINNVEDPTTKLQMLEKGDVDIIDQLDYDLVEQGKANKDLVVDIGQTMDQNYLAFTSNCTTKQSPETSKLMCIKELRQAVAYSIDYDGLIQSVLSGYGVRAPSIIPLGALGVDPAKVWSRDVEKAKALLKTAGYEKGFAMDLYYASNPTRETIAAKIKSDLAEVGIDATLKPLEQSVYLTQMRAQELPTAFGGWTPDYLDVTMWTDYFALGDRSIGLRMQYKNEKATELARQIQNVTDNTARAKLVSQLEDILIDDMPFTMLYQVQRVTAYQSYLKGYKYHPTWFMDFSMLSK